MKTKAPGRAKRRFGQNFLVDAGYAGRIIGLSEIAADDTVVEIGPGRGFLTRLLARTGARIFAIEIDRDLCPGLLEEFRERDNVTILNADALEFDFGQLAGSNRGIKVVANLPYNVATPILFRLFEFRKSIRRMVLMFQKEVAERITASPGSKDYGALSIFPQLYSDIRCAFRLPPGAFRPAPKVFSAVMVFDMLECPRYEAGDEALLRSIVRAAFSQRRKKLSNSLKTLIGDSGKAAALFSSAGIDPSARAENISVEQYCRLSSTASCLELGG